MTSRAYYMRIKRGDWMIKFKKKEKGVQTTSDRTLKRKKFDQWPPYAARRNLIQVNTKYTCTFLHKDFEPRRQLEPKGYGFQERSLPHSLTFYTYM